MSQKQRNNPLEIKNLFIILRFEVAVSLIALKILKTEPVIDFTIQNYSCEVQDFESKAYCRYCFLSASYLYYEVSPVHFT